MVLLRLPLLVWPGATGSVLAPSRHALVTSSFLLLVVWPGATSSVLAPSRNALVTSSFLLLVVWPELLVASLLLVEMRLLLVASCS